MAVAAAVVVEGAVADHMVVSEYCSFVFGICRAIQSHSHDKLDVFSFVAQGQKYWSTLIAIELYTCIHKIQIYTCFVGMG